MLGSVMALVQPRGRTIDGCCSQGRCGDLAVLTGRHEVAGVNHAHMAHLQGLEEHTYGIS